MFTKHNPIINRSVPTHTSRPLDPSVRRRIAEIVPGPIRDYAYEQYKLHWCLLHGITLMDLFAKYSEYWGEVESDEDGMPDFWSWLKETGFAGGQIWPCRNEFLANEYLNAELMLQILPSHSLYQQYLQDIIDQRRKAEEV